MPRSRRGGETGPRLAVLGSAAVVPAGHNLDAVRAELQFHIVQAPRDRCLHHAGLPLAGAVDRDGVGTVLEPDVGEVTAHPGVEGVVQEQIGQYR